MVARRGLLAGAGALVLAGCGRAPGEDEPGGAPPPRTATSRQGDIELLQAAHAMELEEARAYERRDGALFERFAAIEAEHARRLVEALQARGAKPGGSPVAAGREPMEAEGRMIAFYLDMLPKVYDSQLRATIASILVVESEQLAVLRERAGQRPAADAFVYGLQP